LLIQCSERGHTIVSAARGGVFKHFAHSSNIGSARGPAATGSRAVCFTDAGLIVELSDGRVAVSQGHDLTREVSYQVTPAVLTVRGALHRANFETATPLKFIALRLGMLLMGRWFRTWVRRALQRRLITSCRACPVSLTRTVEFLQSGSMRVIDDIELTDADVNVRRMSFGADHQSAYVAASGVYQDAVLQPWQDLGEHVERLNQQRRVTIVRQW
jgi:hypothetical protein